MHLLSTVQCPVLANGISQCPNGTTTGVFEDTCTFSCNAGSELQGSINGTCLANQSWSGGNPICVALNCSTSPPLNLIIHDFSHHVTFSTSQHVPLSVLMATLE